MSNDKATQPKFVQALEALSSSVSTLGTAMAKTVQTKAVEVVSESIDDVEDVVREKLIQYDPKKWIQAHPKTAVGIGVAAGFAVAMQRRVLFRGRTLMSGLTLGFELFQAYQKRKKAPLSTITKNVMH